MSNDENDFMKLLSPSLVNLLMKGVEYLNLTDSEANKYVARKQEEAREYLRQVRKNADALLKEKQAEANTYMTSKKLEAEECLRKAHTEAIEYANQVQGEIDSLDQKMKNIEELTQHTRPAAKTKEKKVKAESNKQAKRSAIKGAVLRGDTTVMKAKASQSAKQALEELKVIGIQWWNDPNKPNKKEES